MSDAKGDFLLRELDDRRGVRDVGRLPGHEGAVTALATSRDGRWVVSGSTDGVARVWDTQDAARMRRLEGHKTAITAVALSGDGSLVLTGASDGTTCVFESETGRLVRPFDPRGGASRSGLASAGRWRRVGTA
jgi:WD40 repeat protein